MVRGWQMLLQLKVRGKAVVGGWRLRGWGRGLFRLLLNRPVMGEREGGGWGEKKSYEWWWWMLRWLWWPWPWWVGYLNWCCLVLFGLRWFKGVYSSFRFLCCGWFVYMVWKRCNVWLFVSSIMIEFHIIWLGWYKIVIASFCNSHTILHMIIESGMPIDSQPWKRLLLKQCQQYEELIPTLAAQTPHPVLLILVQNKIFTPTCLKDLTVNPPTTTQKQYNTTQPILFPREEKPYLTRRFAQLVYDDMFQVQKRGNKPWIIPRVGGFAIHLVWCCLPSTVCMYYVRYKQVEYGESQDRLIDSSRSM